MTELECLSSAFAAIEPTPGPVRLLRRNRHILMALPCRTEAAAKTLELYRPQRTAGRIAMAGLRFSNPLRLHAVVLETMHMSGSPSIHFEEWSGSEAGTCGILLGSPEHRVERAIASYRHSGQWEVAKIAFNAEGRKMLEMEAVMLECCHDLEAGAPRLLGLHYEKNVTVLRMPYMNGRAITKNDFSKALELLHQWISDDPPQPIALFPEWAAIELALSETNKGDCVLARLRQQYVRPVICHGDFARWNLIEQPNGRLTALDWEWASIKGIPGLDLVHYFLQDARLVRRRQPIDAIHETLVELASYECRNYLHDVGWNCDPILPIIACLAWKQGAGHQNNQEILTSALEWNR